MPLAPVIAVVGRSGVGKTRVLSQWLAYLQGLGLKVSLVKHSHHPLLGEGQKSGRHEQAFAEAERLLRACSDGIELRGNWDWLELVELLRQSSQVVLLEGGKSSPYPKIEVVRDHPPLLQPSQLWAYLGVSRGKFPPGNTSLGQPQLPTLPHLQWDDPAGWTDFCQLRQVGRGIPSISSKEHS